MRQRTDISVRQAERLIRRALTPAPIVTGPLAYAELIRHSSDCLVFSMSSRRRHGNGI
jgi:hypothetical protein